MENQEQFHQYIELRKKLIEDYLKQTATGSDFPDRLGDSMRYSLLAGGKRFRPLLLFASYEACGGKDIAQLLPLAAAIECVHTYSLIHDDLPAMDDDDLRRGQPTNHKQFDEATAILAGDGLLTYAFQLIAQSSLSEVIRIRLVEELAVGAGPAGMVYGQMLDIESEGQQITVDQLRAIHQAKTGALIRASLRMGAIATAADEQLLATVSIYGEHLGVLFQITDDILNVTSTVEALGKGVGTDAKNHKVTYASLVGLEQAKRLAQAEYDQTINAIQSIGEAGARLKQCADYILVRI